MFRYSLMYLFFLAVATSEYYASLGEIRFEWVEVGPMLPWLILWILLFPAVYWLIYGGVAAYCKNEGIPIEERRHVYLLAINFTVPVAAAIHLIFTYYLATSGMLKEFVVAFADPIGPFWISFLPIIGVAFLGGVIKVALRIEGKLFAPDLPPISLQLTGAEKAYSQANMQSRMALMLLLVGCVIYFIPGIFPKDQMAKNVALLGAVIFALGVWLSGDKARKAGKRFGLGLPNEELTQRANILADIMGTRSKPVMVKEGLFADNMIMGKAARRAVSVTKGSLDQLTYEQMEFLLAHELAHYWQNYMNKVVAMSAGFAIVAVGPILYYPNLDFARSHPAAIFLLALLLIPVYMLFTRGLRLWGRQREFEADKIAAIAVRNPIAGVECLSLCRSTSPRPYIHDYYVSMHPPLDLRLEALKNMPLPPA